MLLTQPFAEALAEAEKIITSAPHINSERDLAEGYDYLAGSIQASLRLAWAYERDFPCFVTSTGPYAKMGLDNPDTLYFHAYLRDDAEYLVTGTRGTTADLSFQVLKGDYSPAEVPDSLSAFDDRAFATSADGTYELRFGPGDPAWDATAFCRTEIACSTAISLCRVLNLPQPVNGICPRRLTPSAIRMRRTAERQKNKLRGSATVEHGRSALS